MKNECGWIALAGTSPSRDHLKGVEKADWLIIGAGITGLSAAHSLAQLHPQARIVIVDRQRAAQGASARNSGYAVAHENPGDNELIGKSGFAGYAVDSTIGQAAGDEVRMRIARHGIDCDYRDSGYYFAVNDPGKLTQVEAKLKTLQAVGASAHFLQGAQLAQTLGTGHYQAAIWCGNGNALLQPAKYVKGLLDALPANVSLFENTDITGLERLTGGRIRAKGSQGSIEAAQVLVCLNAFIPRAGIDKSATFPMELSASLTRPLTDKEYEAIGSVDPGAGDKGIQAYQYLRGFNAALAAPGPQLAQALGTRHYQAAIWCGNGNALLQPAKYVKGLLDALPANVSLFENTDISGLERLSGGRIRARGSQGSGFLAGVLGRRRVAGFLF